ncbi:MAG: hypothetical protein ACOYJH_00020 [Anaerovoracaceae bacterium]
MRIMHTPMSFGEAACAITVTYSGLTSGETYNIGGTDGTDLEVIAGGEEPLLPGDFHFREYAVFSRCSGGL